MSSETITFHNVERPAFEALRRHLLNGLGAERVGGDELRCLGVRGTLKYDEKRDATTVSLRHVPSVFNAAQVFTWLHETLADARDGRVDGHVGSTEPEGDLYWDQLTLKITNSSGLTLNVSNVPTLSHGEYSTYPVSVPSGPQETAFVASSKLASEIGPAGSMTYNLADGTVLNINFDMQFPVGQKSTFTASLSGARNGSYGLAISDSHSDWEGQGTRWAVDLTLNPNPGSTTVEASYTR
ncbi:hypothetical protein [Streptosporangium sp. NBC_01469]|uniref:hypothetical protein n=1 Tax=Streptosporangium sp. NBC_01469 TaxID=2903898 RepID=UPI002E2983ED|nr:hypothetical protein [Streptosporangium sp. NBC_01469]